MGTLKPKTHGYNICQHERSITCLHHHRKLLNNFVAEDVRVDEDPARVPDQYPLLLRHNSRPGALSTRHTHLCAVPRCQDRKARREAAHPQRQGEHDHDPLVRPCPPPARAPLILSRMRSMHDAILIGIGTALNDNPQLNSTPLPPPRLLIHQCVVYSAPPPHPAPRWRSAPHTAARDPRRPPPPLPGVQTPCQLQKRNGPTPLGRLLKNSGRRCRRPRAKASARGPGERRGAGHPGRC